MAVGVDKGENIRKAIKLVNDAKSKGSSLVVLPECFNCPYGTSKLSYFSFRPNLSVGYFRLRIWQTLVSYKVNIRYILHNVLVGQQKFLGRY